MKILILANDYKTVANFRMELLERLIADGHQVVLSLPSFEGNNLFREMGCLVCENNMTRHGTNLFAEASLIGQYKALMQQVKPDVVLTYTIKPNIYGSLAARQLHIPVLNNVTGIGSLMQGNGLKQKVMFALMRYAMASSQVIFFQNQGNLELFNSKKIGLHKSVLLPGSGVNLQKHPFVPYPEERDKIKLIAVSRLRQDKGFDELFETVRLLGGSSGVQFHIVGWCEEPQYLEQIQLLTQQYDVIYHGEKTQQEVHSLIAQCHGIVHPSYHEGMANVLLEASAAGRACLASNIPGCREIVDNGKSGILIEAHSAEALTDAVERFLQISPSQREEMGRCARAKIEQEFDRQFVVDSYIANIQQVTKQAD